MVIVSLVTPTSLLAVVPVVPWLTPQARLKRRPAVATARVRNRGRPIVMLHLLKCRTEATPSGVPLGQFTDNTLGEIGWQGETGPDPRSPDPQRGQEAHPGAAAGGCAADSPLRRRRGDLGKRGRPRGGRGQRHLLRALRRQARAAAHARRRALHEAARRAPGAALGGDPGAHERGEAAAPVPGAPRGAGRQSQALPAGAARAPSTPVGAR